MICSEDYINKVIFGDCRTGLQDIPDYYVDMCITSPPYWGLRDYGFPNQIGLESTVDEYIETICGVFDEVWRVMKDEGTCWVNLGDTYSGSGIDIPKKSLCGIPFRFAIKMIERGWILRNTIIWHKPNGMPSSVKDRFTVNFEYLFFFTKQQRYFFNQDAVRDGYGSDHRVPGIVRHKEKGYNGKGAYQDWYNNDREKRSWKSQKDLKTGFAQIPKLTHPKGKNRRCVWTISTQPSRVSHYAMFPEQLITIPILAGCPIGGIVLDPFAGTGTVGKMARYFGRNYILIEASQEYCNIAKSRINEPVKFRSKKKIESGKQTNLQFKLSEL